jgi:hypothetical protein
MEIRKYLNENPLVAGALTVGLLVVAILFAIFYFRSAAPPEPLTGKPDFTKGFYSDDDGQSFFVDAVGKVTPFTHNGKQAVRAYLFRCGSTTFVGLLGRGTDAAKLRPDVNMLGGDYKAITVTAAKPPVFEIKKPKGGAWTPVTTGANDPWHKELAVECPGGGSDIPMNIAPGQQQ